MQINSCFAILDVKGGKAALRKLIQEGEGPDVVIRGRVVGVYGHDDGISQEFKIVVTSVKES